MALNKEIFCMKIRFSKGGDCPKTKIGLSNCTKNKQKMDRETFEKAENQQKNCAECTSVNEFSDSLGRLSENYKLIVG